MATNGTNGAGKHSVPAAVTPPVAKPTRKNGDTALTKLVALDRAANRPLPNRFGDGRGEADPPAATGIRHDIATLRKGGFLAESIRTLSMFLKGKLKGGLTDDKTMIVHALPSVRFAAADCRRWSA